MSLASLTPGRLWYLTYHQPLAALARCRREGGPWQQWLDLIGQRRMRYAAAALPPISSPPAGAPEITFLTGRRFWYQTAFCCWTLRQHAPRELRPVFIDDGSFDRALHTECLRLFPGARIDDQRSIARRLDSCLPASRFPALRAQRLSYVHLRKLTDVHAGRTGWQVVLDSDMLFFRPPNALLDWLAAAERGLHMLDVHDSYGYPPATLEALAGGRIPSRVNVGICGLLSDEIDWPLWEYWCGELLQRHGSSYYLEQALVALWLSRHPASSLSATDYRLMPTPEECRAPTAILHHYVASSKRGYFREAWSRALTRVGTTNHFP